MNRGYAKGPKEGRQHIPQKKKKKQTYNLLLHHTLSNPQDEPFSQPSNWTRNPLQENHRHARSIPEMKMAYRLDLEECQS